jgi:flagellar biogenesis protein FliO
MFETFSGAAQNGLPFVVAFIVALALIAATAWLVRRAGSNRARTETSRGHNQGEFNAQRQRRLAVIDTASSTDAGDSSWSGAIILNI